MFTTLLQTDQPMMTDGSLQGARLRLLFAKHDLGYPRSRGHDIRAYNMMRALGQLGHRVGLLTVEEPSAQAIDGLRMANSTPSPEGALLRDPGNRRQRFQSRRNLIGAALLR